MARFETNVRIGIDGRGVRPKTVDPRALLDLAIAFFEAIEAEARTERSRVSFVGLSIDPGSANVATLANQPETVRRAAREIRRRLASPSRGDEPGHIDRLRRRIEHLQESKLSAKADVLGEVIPIRAIGVALDERRVTEALVLRVTPISLFAPQGEARARLASHSEPESFLVGLDLALARKLGASLLADVDADLVLVRDGRGAIVSGRMEGFERVTQGDALETWRDAFKEQISRWSKPGTGDDSDRRD